MKKLNQYLLATTFIIALSHGEAFAKLCATNSAEEESRNASMAQKCAGVRWDMSQYTSDNSVCASRKQGLDLVESVVVNFCTGNESEFTSKIKTIFIKTWANKTTVYELKGSTLNATVPIEETPILTNWNNETEKLNKFFKEKVGLVSGREKAEAANNKKEAAARQEQENKIKAANASRDQARDQAQAKRTAAQDKLKAAMEVFKAKSIAIMSRPGSSPDDMAKKQKEVADAQADFNKAQAEYNSEMAAIK